MENQTQTQNKKEVNLSVSKKLKKIGFVLLAIGIVFFIIGAVKMSAYNKAYDEWRQKFMEHTATLNTKPEMPFWPFIVGSLISFPALPLLFLGFQPQLHKMTVKMSKEVLDYTGDDITELGKRTIDVASPVINKATDDIIAPTIGKVAKSVKTAIKDGEESMFCKHCGAEIDADSKFCNKCGKEQ